MHTTTVESRRKSGDDADLRTLKPKLAIFAAALIWGSSFVMMKNAVGVFPTYTLLAFRFSIACALLCLIYYKRLKGIDRDYLKKTAVIGICLFLAYSFQTVGIRYTTPGKNAFLTATYVIIVPFFHWLVGKHRPGVKNIVAACACLVGIALISFVSAGDAASPGLGVIGFGDALTLVCGFFYAAHMVFLGIYSVGKDPVLLTILQFGYCAIFFSLIGFSIETMPRSVEPAAVCNVLYLAVFCTAIAMLFQNYGQKYTSPAAASLIMSLESVFGVLFSVFFYGEVLTPRLITGFLLVFAAILLSEIQISRQRPRSPAVAVGRAREQR
ncbi:MAG: DMT family transporter [Clostridiales bacterium]|nr:DMT family transporter [Clostridiales bacterium]